MENGQQMIYIDQTSDGYHTFDELYEHRHALFITLCWLTPAWCWRSWLHADGTMFDGWFVMGLCKQHGNQISYHLPARLWDRTGFAETLSRAPEWDGHTPFDVIDRLYNRMRKCRSYVTDTGKCLQ